jgi:hypothetical protein
METSDASDHRFQSGSRFINFSRLRRRQRRRVEKIEELLMALGIQKEGSLIEDRRLGFRRALVSMNSESFCPRRPRRG